MLDLVALVLAGGRGTRLQTAVGDLPKVLAPVRGRPFVARVLDRIAEAGIAKAVICTGHGAAQVRETLGASHGELALVYSHEEAPLGTGGALRRAAEEAACKTLLAFNGDSLCEADLGALAAFHETKGARATILLASVEDGSRYGRVEAGADGRVLEFEEKARPGPGWINAGVYCLSRAALLEIPAGRAVSLERELLPSWIGRGLFAFPCAGRFLDIGTPEDYGRAEIFFGRD